MNYFSDFFKQLYEHVKLIAAFVLLVSCCKKVFDWYAKKLFPSDFGTSIYDESTDGLRKKMRFSIFLNTIFFSIAMLSLAHFYRIDFSVENRMQIVASYLLLVIALGSGSWRSYKKITLVERVEKTITYCAKYCNVLIFLFILYHPAK